MDFITFMLLFSASVFLLSFENKGLVTNFTAVAACINNIGPGLELVGPTQTFAFFAPGYKLLFCALMLLGRLEFFTLLALITPRRFRERI